MNETTIGILVGAGAYALGVLTAYVLVMRSLRSGVNISDRIHHDQVPFDEDLINEPMQSHTDGTVAEE